MPETKPIAKWRLNLAHPFIIFMMTLGILPLYEIKHFILIYLIATLPIYLFITIIMYLPKIPLFLRLMLNLIAMSGYAVFFSHLIPDEDNLNFLVPLTPLFGYILFIWVGYISKPQTSKKGVLYYPTLILFLTVIFSATQIKVTVIFFIFTIFIGVF